MSVAKNNLSSMVARLDVQQKFEALLKEKAPSFISSMLQIVNGNDLLKKADPVTVLNAAATAAALDLPINPNLGFAWIVPYKGKAQFQMGWKGYVQLAHRSKEYNKINVVPVYSSQFKSWNPITEFLDCEWTAKQEGEVVGYAAYFKLLNGFEKFVYWPKEKVTKHGQKYSQSYGKNWSAWKTSFDEMAMKTVLKNTLAKWGVLSVEMQTAQLADQSIQEEAGQYKYLDNLNSIDITKTEEEKEKARIVKHIEKAGTLEKLEQVRQLITDKNYTDLALAYNAKELKINKKNEIEKN